MTIKYTDFAGNLRFFGRCYNDAARQEVWFDWTMSGFEVAFEGSELTADFSVIAVPFPGPGNIPDPECPCIGIVVDDETEPSTRIELTADGTYTLFKGESGKHVVRVYKLSEGMRGQNGISAISTDGEFVALPEHKAALRMEFIGDSITCGFGNEAPEPHSPFRTCEENGWLAYAATAARKLNADANYLCVSGIAVSRPKNPMPFNMGLPAMEDLYEYTDGIYESKRGIEEKVKWDFAANPRDVVVINLGTNDYNPIRFTQDMNRKEEEQAYFGERYRAFVEMIRRCNGPDTFICCTLGSMSHYMFDIIRSTVEAYKAETGDNNIVCFKYDMINEMFDGIGGLGHPSLKTHAKMADELVWLVEEKYIKTRG